MKSPRHQFACLKILRVALLACAIGAIVVAPPARADDQVKLFSGSPSLGKITEISPTEVVVELGQNRKKLAVNEIDMVTFEGEPAALGRARTSIRGGRFQEAAASLGRIETQGIIREEIVHDIEYFRALAPARMALAGQGSLADAAKKMQAFEKAHPTSFHHFEACETVGDLLAAQGKYEQAEAFYEKVAEAPWPEYKLRAGVSLGRALTNNKKYDQALQQFQRCLSIQATGKEPERLRLAARLGAIAATAGTGKTDEAVKSIEAFIANTEPDNLEIQARAYNVMGNIYKQAGKKKEALYAFLHVDLLFSRYPEQHAEALSNLAVLWPDDRAAKARATLKEKYPDSPWAKQ